LKKNEYFFLKEEELFFNKINSCGKEKIEFIIYLKTTINIKDFEQLSKNRNWIKDFNNGVIYLKIPLNWS